MDVPSSPDEIRLELVQTDCQGEIELGEVTAAGRDEEATLVECPVCTENTAEAEMVLLAACGDPAHGVCLRCAFAYIHGRIGEMRTEELFCAMGVAEGGCSGTRTPAQATEEEVILILSAVDDAAVERYRRFKRMKADRSLCACPGCGQLCPPNLLQAGQGQSTVTCEACGASFCYWHAWAHKGDTCEVYEARLREEEKEIAQLFGTKACPGCTWQTEKTGGCNHMTCRQCNCDWCWSCGQLIEGNVVWHFSADNAASTCRQFDAEAAWEVGEARQAAAHRTAPEDRLVRCVRSCGRCFGRLLIFWFLITSPLVLGVFVLPLWTVFCCLWCLCCCCCADQAGHPILTTLNRSLMVACILGFLVTVLPMIPIVLVWYLLVHCILLPASVGYGRGRAWLLDIIATPFELIGEHLHGPFIILFDIDSD